jgi:hypothetical protein
MAPQGTARAIAEAAAVRTAELPLSAEFDQQATRLRALAGRQGTSGDRSSAAG